MLKKTSVFEETIQPHNIQAFWTKIIIEDIQWFHFQGIM